MIIKRIARSQIGICFSFISVLTSITFSGNSLTTVPASYEELCSDYDAVETYEQETFEEFIKNTGNNLDLENRYYFAVTPFANGNKARMLGTQTFTVPEKSHVTIEIKMYTDSLSETQIRYLALLNEQPLILDKDFSQYSTVFTLVRGEISTLTLSLPMLEEGVNDFVFLAIPNINEPLPSTGSPIAHAIRMSLLVGDDAIRKTQNINYELLTPTAHKSPDNPTLILGMTLDNSLKQWNYPNPTHVIENDEALIFNVLTGAPDDITHNYRFALIGFVDYKPILMNATLPVLYGQVSPDTAFTRISIKSDVELESGIYDVMMIRINDPRIPSCVLIDKMQYYPINVMRVAVEIR